MRHLCLRIGGHWSYTHHRNRRAGAGGETRMKEARRVRWKLSFCTVVVGQWKTGKRGSLYLASVRSSRLEGSRQPLHHRSITIAHLTLGRHWAERDRENEATRKWKEEKKRYLYICVYIYIYVYRYKPGAGGPLTFLLQHSTLRCWALTLILTRFIVVPP